MSSLLLWNFGWSAALAVVAFCLGRLPSLQRRPALMHLLWFGVLLRLVVPALVAVPILPDTTATVRVQADFTQAVPQKVSVEIVPIPETPLPVEPVPAPTATWDQKVTLSHSLLFVSLAGTVVLLMQSWLRCRWLHRLQQASQVAPQPLHDLAARLAGEMNLTAVPRLRVVEGLASPSLWGFGRRTTILLPRHLVDEFDTDQWTCILAHELAHVLRGDVWFNLIAASVLHLCWWNPIAWWAYREMRACQEASCDAIALAGTSPSRRQYAETLLQVVDSWTRPSLIQPHVLLGFGTRSVLTRRFEMIANSQVRPKAALAAMVCLSLLVISFFCLPVRAEKKGNSPSKEELEAVKAKLTKLVEEVDALIAKQNAENAPAAEDEKITLMKSDSRDHLKTIMLAMHIYHDQHGSFPPAVLYGKDNKGGKHPHSWRVALLPYINQQKLYDSYHFDEPWDSDANIEVMAKMPDIYRAPGEERKYLHPAYVVLVGKLLEDDNEPMKLQTMFSSKKGMRIQKMLDGASNTLAVVETKMEGKQAIQWTEPKDLEYDPSGELPKLGGLYADGFWMGEADGAAIFVSSKTKESTLKALITPAAGEVIDWPNQNQ